MLGYKVGYARLPGTGCPDGWPGRILGFAGGPITLRKSSRLTPKRLAAQRANAQKSTGPRDRWGNGGTTAQAPQNHPLIPSLSKEGKQGEARAHELDASEELVRSPAKNGGPRLRRRRRRPPLQTDESEELEPSATTGGTPVPQAVEGNNAE